MHPTTGELRAYLDGEVPQQLVGSIQGHLEACGACRDVLRRIRDNEAVVHDAMDLMDSHPDLPRARRELRRRLESRGVEAHDPGDSSRGWRDSLRIAALLLLLLGGITAALPGSPVRSWLLDVFAPSRSVPSAPLEGDGAEEPVEVSPGGNAESPDAATVRVDPSEGAVRIDLSGVESETRVRIVFVEGERAGVSADEASAYRTGAGFLGIVDPGDSVTIELPRGIPSARIRVGQVILFQKSGDSVDFPSLTPEPDGDAFVLTIPSGFGSADGIQNGL